MPARRPVGLAAALRAPLRRLHREADGEDQHRAVEERLDEERRAELVQAGDGHRQHRDREHRAPDIDAARPDRGRAEQRRGEGRQQILLADRALPDLELRLQHDAGEGGERAGGDEAERDVALGRDAVQLRRARAGAEHVEVAAERQVLEHDPEHEADDQRVERRRGDDADVAGDGEELRRQVAKHLLAAGVPGVQAVEDGAGAERGDEGVDLHPRHQEAVDQPDERAHQQHGDDRRPPGQALPLQADRQHLARCRR